MRLKLSIFLLFIWCQLSLVQAQIPAEPWVKEECQDDSDCEPYEFCNISLWNGTTCLTNYKKEEDNDRIVFCGKEDENGFEYPDHKVCWQSETEKSQGTLQEPKYAVSMCYAELDFSCAKAYYAPCSNVYDKTDGSILYEGVCPRNFKCVDQEYTNKAVSLKHYFLSSICMS